MKLFGWTLARTDALVKSGSINSALVTDVSSFRGGWARVLESASGAWQRNLEITNDNVLAFAPVYSCVTLIASDIAKVRIKLVEQDADQIWNEIASPAFSPVLRKPNHYQTRIRFIETWMTSKLISGNAYALKERDKRGVVTALYILNPNRVFPFISPDGGVYYQLGNDPLSGLTDSVVVPASEIIHDIYASLYHPLCGISPISACGLAAIQGLNAQRHAARSFANGSIPSGLLVVPGTISNEIAAEMQLRWEQNFSGENVGRVAVLGNGLQYQAMTVKAEDAQLIEQLKWTAEDVCTAYHVPAYMIGVGTSPTHTNIEALSVQYYTQCLQTHIESIELLLDEGLGLDKQVPAMGTEFDLDALMRLDTTAAVEAASKGIGCGALSPNEARRIYFGLPPVKGGDTPYLQQQNYSLSALNKRDTLPDPFAKTPTDPTGVAPTPPDAGPVPPPPDPPIKHAMIAMVTSALATKAFHVNDEVAA